MFYFSLKYKTEGKGALERDCRERRERAKAFEKGTESNQTDEGKGKEREGSGEKRGENKKKMLKRKKKRNVFIFIHSFSHSFLFVCFLSTLVIPFSLTYFRFFHELFIVVNCYWRCAFCLFLCFE